MTQGIRQLPAFVSAFATMILLTVLIVGCGSQGSSGSDDPSGDADSGGSSSGSGSSSGERIEVGGSEALVWGEGEQGVVLSHGAAYDAASWETQASQIAETGATVLAVEDISAESVQAATSYLRDERDVQDVALLGASAGSTGVLEVGQQSPGRVDQLMLLSGTGSVSGLGEYPKLFIASEGEGLAEQVRQMAEEAPGNRNEALIVEGSAHAQAIFDTPQGEEVLNTIIDRLERF